MEQEQQIRSQAHQLLMQAVVAAVRTTAQVVQVALAVVVALLELVQLEQQTLVAAAVHHEVIRPRQLMQAVQELLF